MTYTSEYHRNAELVRLCHGLFVPYAAAGLHDGSDSVSGRQFHGVGERQEAVGGKDETIGEAGLTGLLKGYMGGADTVGLPCSYAHRVAVTDHGYGVGFDVLDYLPAEFKVGKLRLVGSLFGHTAERLSGLDLRVKLLDQHPAVDSDELPHRSLAWGHIHLKDTEVLLGGEYFQCLGGE